MAAAEGGFLEAVDILIDYGADINAKTSKNRWTPLMYAAVGNKINVAKKLLDSNANSKLTDHTKMTAANLAEEYDHPDMVKLLNSHVKAPDELRSNTSGNSADDSSGSFRLKEPGGRAAGSRPQLVVPTTARNASVATWVVDDVYNWAKENKLDEEFFRTNDVDGAFLIEFDDSILVEMGLTSRVKRLRIITKLKKLKAGQETPSTPGPSSSGVGGMSGGYDLPADTSVDLRFNHIRMLGRGSFGVTSLVEDKTTKELFALKELACVTQADANVAMREAVTMLTYRSHALVQCYDVFLGRTSYGESCVNIVMEFCDQGDLNDVLKKHKEVSLENAERWLTSILEGLEFIHGEGIIHRDLKPGNVLMTGDPPKAKLGDFGLARESTATLKSVAGTVAYMAPEVFHGKYDTPVDIWSLGAMMIEVSARVKLSQPFTNIEEVRASLAKIPARFGDEFVNKIFMMLCMDAEARPTAAELLRGMDVDLHDSSAISSRPGRRKSTVAQPLNFIADTMEFPIDFQQSQSGNHAEVSEVADHGTVWARIEKSGGTNLQLRQFYEISSAVMVRTMQRMLQFTSKSHEFNKKWNGPAGLKVPPNSAELAWRTAVSRRFLTIYPAISSAEVDQPFYLGFYAADDEATARRIVNGKMLIPKVQGEFGQGVNVSLDARSVLELHGKQFPGVEAIPLVLCLLMLGSHFPVVETPGGDGGLDKAGMIANADSHVALATPVEGAGFGASGGTRLRPVTQEECSEGPMPPTTFGQVVLSEASQVLPIGYAMMSPL